MSKDIRALLVATRNLEFNCLPVIGVDDLCTVIGVDDLCKSIAQWL
jgi:hypothetical protein